MKELTAIIKAFDQAEKLGKKAALATVVQVEGSSYRRAGARMLVTEDGELTGAISGGCLEGDALRKARLVISQQKAMLVTYDTTDEDDAKLGVGLGCNGIIQILIEPINAGEPLTPIRLLRSFLSKRDPAVLITVFNMDDRQKTQFGTCMLVERGGHVTGELNHEIMSEEILNDAVHVLQEGNRDHKTYVYKNGYTCFIELLEPAVSLIIAGAGNDALPLVEIAKVLGWTVTLADGRANYNTPERFPIADKRIIAKPEAVMKELQPDERTVFMLMTHNYNYDLALLEQLLPLNPPYIGVLGPKKRLDRMIEELTSSLLSAKIPENLHGPAGLDLGSENAEEIALSIVAEIQSVMKQRDGRPLKEKVLVHKRTEVQNH
ncbi:XdhC family protein [Mucilaginibacter sp. UR6-1]|uniref:XdhC family protein n=1 Tax=Mucilaginibacter sp. UR6-1 TaxID=1435643 RepID=UPI001E5F3F66|nr:XdhC/CoxI family protein [Mucilaginibacter sp. UR6-1]MCC8409453.1 XdhC family protein [Mucilaginibacter sp. UR6-1]